MRIPPVRQRRMDLGVAGRKTTSEMMGCRVAFAGDATVIWAKGISGLVGSRFSLVVINLRVTMGLLDEKTLRTMDLFLNHRTRNE